MLKDNYINIKNNISSIADDVILLAATKTQSTQTINGAISLGIRHIGENRVQEFTTKYNDILKEYNGEKVFFHFIGTLQSNKVKYIIDKVDLIHSVDSFKLACEIDRQAAKINKVQNILIEINISGDENKSGADVMVIDELIEKISELKNVKINGLMCIGGLNMNKQQTNELFAKMFQVFIDKRDKKLDNVNMKYLSMGMSGDYELAIKNGANIVRLGSALFGNRL